MLMIEYTSPAKKEKAQEYIDYIEKHVANVEKAFNDYGKILADAANIGYVDLYERVMEHDTSKYSEEEFEGYRQWFYAVEGETKNKALFNKAWFHHFRNNDHHPEFWTSIDGNNIMHPNPMSAIALVEMILDWLAMSYAGMSNIHEYWESERDNKVIHPDTVRELDRLLEVVKCQQ